MSNWAEIVVHTIKEKRKKNYKVEKIFIVDLLGAVFSIIGVFVLPFNMPFLNYQWSKIILFLAFVGSFFFGYRLFMYIRKNPYNPKNHSKFMLDVKNEMDQLGVNTKEIVDELISELDEEIRRIEENEKSLLSKISKAFFWVFWAPFAFLTKYVIENKILDIEKPEDYFQIVGFLLTFLLICIVLLISNTNPLETTNYFRKTTIKEAKQSLTDIRYLYNKDIKTALDNINKQATADEHAPSVGGEL